jgi:SAM-dependent methyltransferase
VTSTDSRYLRFWQTQSRSLHREDDDSFYARKAKEHVGLMTDDAGATVADFACGAGELLSNLVPLVDVEEASDFSESMLAQARQRLAGADVALIHADGMEHGRTATQPVWTTCGGLNQYLDPDLLRQWIEVFDANPAARSLYLFDTVDPIRYRALASRSRYAEQHPSAGLRARRRIWSAGNALTNLAHRQWAYLGSPAMGFGFTPSFLRDIASDVGLSARFCSSREYEYRFHAILRKQ